MDHEEPPGGQAQPGRPITQLNGRVRAAGPSAIAPDWRELPVAPPGSATVAIAVDAIEIFRLAIAEGDQAAWEAICAEYHGLVRAWLRRHPAASLAGETDDYLVNCAFERFWLCIGPERFGAFAGLPALLQYLKLCAHSVLVDEVRAQARQRPEAANGWRLPAAFEDAVIERVTAHDLWLNISAEAHDEAELLVATLSFVHGLKPGEIYKQHPEQYADVAEVYRVKRNLLERLRRNETIRRAYG